MKQLEFRKNINIRAESLIETLHTNINKNSPVVNIEAFKNHNANFRVSVIDKYFSEIGIKSTSNSVRKYEPFKSYLDENISNSSLTKNSVVFQKLEHLCDLRNDIAHGVNNVQLLHKSIIFQYIDFMKLYCSSLSELVYDSYLSKVYETNNDKIDVIKIYNNSILCFNTKGTKINKRTKILIKNNNNYPSVIIANILSIQVNSDTIEETELKSSINIGVSLDKKIKANMSFKLIFNEGSSQI